MISGSLRHKLCLMRQTEVLNTYGEREDLWTQTATVRGSIEPIRGREFFAASGEHAEVTHRVRYRRSRRVECARPRDRFEHQGRVFEIKSIINNMNGRDVEAMCVEELND